MAKKQSKKKKTELNTNCDQSLEVQKLHLNQQDIEKLIYVIRGTQVMLDSDLATLYGVETRALNQAVKRNINRFPDDFMFQLMKVEWANLKSQIVTSNTSENQSVVVLASQNVILKNGRGQHSKFMPYAFTRNGIAMLSSVLRSQIAVEVNISIMRAFTATQQFFAANAQMFQRIEIVEHHQLALAAHQQDTDQQVQQILKRLDDKSDTPTQGIFFDGQFFDAYTFVSDLIRSAKKSIVLFDNYVDDTVLTMLDKRKEKVTAEIYTKNITKQFSLDIAKHNAQYSLIIVKSFEKVHDRFLCIDNTVYHIGASLKDLGKRWFAFTKMEMTAKELLGNVK
ncbi:MAG: ORF6N domain-containing protein [Bacteroidales bacterium]|nr:ORF6N domain-containing protein [Bacteroidales bacterium]